VCVCVCARQQFYKFIDNVTGSQDFNISNLWDVADTLYCEVTV